MINIDYKDSNITRQQFMECAFVIYTTPVAKAKSNVATTVSERATNANVQQIRQKIATHSACTVTLLDFYMWDRQ